MAKNITSAETNELKDNEFFNCVFDTQPSNTFRITRFGEWLRFSFVGLTNSHFWIPDTDNVLVQVGKTIPYEQYLAKAKTINEVDLTNQEKDNLSRLVRSMLTMKIASISVPDGYGSKS